MREHKQTNLYAFRAQTWMFFLLEFWKEEGQREREKKLDSF